MWVCVSVSVFWVEKGGGRGRFRGSGGGIRGGLNVAARTRGGPLVLGLGAGNGSGGSGGATAPLGHATLVAQQAVGVV